MTGIFILSIVIGLLISSENPTLSENYFKTLKNLFDWIKTLNPVIIMLVIFLNNALKSLIALVLGIGFGIIPLLFVAANGVIIGILADLVSKQQGTAFFIAATLPHGVIEIPMILLSASIGLRLGYVMYLSLKGIKTEKHEFETGFMFYMKWIVPLFFVAAIIETFVTPRIAFGFMANYSP